MILVNGCSFSAPSDDNDSWVSGLYNKGFDRYNYKIPSSIEQKYAVRNIAVGGSSNTVIRRKTFWYLNDLSHKHMPDYMIIQWSTIDRWDYPTFVSEEKANTFPRIKDISPHWANKINYMCNGTDTMGYAKDFYEKYYSFYGAVLDTLENIYHTQQYLNTKGIPYKMLTIGNLFDMDVSIEKLIKLQTDTIGQSGNYATLKTNKSIFDKLEPFENSWYELDTLKALLNKIDFSKFIFTDDVNISGFGGGLIEWFLNKNEMLSGGQWHPSGEQHIRFFNEFLWPKIEKEVEQYSRK